MHPASSVLDCHVLGTGAGVERRTLGTVEASKLVEEANDVGGRQGSAALEVFGREELDWTNLGLHRNCSMARTSARSCGRPLRRFMVMRSSMDNTSTGPLGSSLTWFASLPSHT